MGRVALHREGLTEIKIKLLVGVINNKILISNTFLHQIMGHGAGFWLVNNRHIE